MEWWRGMCVCVQFGKIFFLKLCITVIRQDFSFLKTFNFEIILDLEVAFPPAPPNGT